MTIAPSKLPGILALVAVVGLAACGDDPFQVIEETTFAASLGIDLTAMERLETGVYIQDIELGTGTAAEIGSEANATYTGWLSDGTEFDSATDFTFIINENSVIPGFVDGLLGMQAGGTRLMVIPPERAYEDRQVGIIPPGSILIFRVTLVELTPPAEPPA